MRVLNRAALLLCGASALGCTDGYPTNDAVRLDAMSPVEHVRSLNRYLELSRAQSDTRLTVIDACTLSSRGEAKQTRIGLRAFTVTFDTRPDSGEYLVNVRKPAAADSGQVSYAVKDWVAATAFRSHLQQLQQLCLDGSRSAATG
ncbi:hypothetical protein [Variovorax saccharolyticus]|uniref:hypothetical protein n=1 Tax=Variovorax saccharolyticus TaxID=3053516 RepID=UPI002576BD45|nr:hypothetical protein [Variovorax sp. J31P216]MDM0026341.1 hypothetical protein [Variovorax sp. J31P216]